MKTLLIAAALLALAAPQAGAQTIVYRARYAPVVAAYAPPVYATPAYTPYYAGYAPAPPVVAAPVAPAPVAVAPVVVQRVVYRPVAAPLAPVAVVGPVAPVVTTRYRPLLGGTVSRVRYAPAVLAY